MGGGKVIADGWLTIEEAAETTGYVPPHLNRLARAGKVEAQRVGRSWLFNAASLAAWKSTARPGPKGPRKREAEAAE